MNLLGFTGIELYPWSVLPLQKPTKKTRTFSEALSEPFCNKITRVVLIELDSGTSLTLSQTINLRLYQTERVCRRQFEI